jgi:hypothetical protein
LYIHYIRHLNKNHAQNTVYQIGLIISMNYEIYLRFFLEFYFLSYAISYDAERSRNVSHAVRQDGRRLINETYNESWWNKHDK